MGPGTPVRLSIGPRISPRIPTRVRSSIRTLISPIRASGVGPRVSPALRTPRDPVPVAPDLVTPPPPLCLGRGSGDCQASSNQSHRYEGHYKVALDHDFLLSRVVA